MGIYVVFQSSGVTLMLQQTAWYCCNTLSQAEHLTSFNCSSVQGMYLNFTISGNWASEGFVLADSHFCKTHVGRADINKLVKGLCLLPRSWFCFSAGVSPGGGTCTPDPSRVSQGQSVGGLRDWAAFSHDTIKQTKPSASSTKKRGVSPGCLKTQAKT